MESILTRTSVERRDSLSSPRVDRRGSLSPPRVVDELLAPINMPDVKSDLKQSRQKLRRVAVMGKGEGICPKASALQAFVKQITGQEPESIKVKPDDSFVITCITEGEAKQLIEARLLFEEKLIHLEGWSPQADPEKTVFLKRLLKVNLPKLRDECVDMAADLVAALGVL